MDPLGTLLIMAAAVMWALIGAFSKALLARGLGPMEIAFWRASLAGVMFVAHAALTGKLRLRLTDLPALLAFGFLGVTVFYGAYQVAVRDVGMALASVLLYTAPAWVALLSWRLLGETMSWSKAACVVLTVATRSSLKFCQEGRSKCMPRSSEPRAVTSCSTALNV